MGKFFDRLASYGENWEARRAREMAWTAARNASFEIAEALVGGPDSVPPRVIVYHADFDSWEFVLRAQRGGSVPRALAQAVRDGALDYSGFRVQVLTVRGPDVVIRISAFA